MQTAQKLPCSTVLAVLLRGNVLAYVSSYQTSTILLASHTYYRIAGNFGGSKLWRMVLSLRFGKMVLNLRFGEFNFGGYVRFPPQYIAVK